MSTEPAEDRLFSRLARRNQIVFLTAVVLTLSPILTSIPANAAISAIERAALIALYNSTNGDGWNNNSGWKAEALHTDGFAMPGTEDTWFGVTTNTGNTQVTIVMWRDNHLVGTIPAELGNLEFLERLDLSFNELAGTIPSELMNITALNQARLEYNCLSTTDDALREFLEAVQWTLIPWEDYQCMPAPPITPTNVAASDERLPNTIALTWDDQPTETEYWVYRHYSVPGYVRIATTAADVTGYQDISFYPCGTSHGYQVSAYSSYYAPVPSHRETDPSPMVLGSTRDCDHFLPTPQDLSASDGTEVENITVTWKDVANEDGYRVYRASHPNWHDYSLVGTTAANVTTYVDTSHSCFPVNSYYYMVTAYDAEGESIPSAVDEGSVGTGILAAEERTALIALYNSTDGDSWTDNTGWKDGPLHTDGFAMPGTEHSWFYIRMNCWNTHVKHLYLNDNNLVGTIPAELEALSGATRIALDYNELSGAIPTELGNLSSAMALGLSSNQLTGTVPAELANLSNLNELLLDNNLLTDIPAELGSLPNLWIVTLNDNLLTGGIPPELGNLPRILQIYLENNEFTGPIPLEFLDNLSYHSSIQGIDLEGNRLSGMIPVEFANLPSLTYLNLGGNELSGVIPAELWSLPKLRTLRLDNNKLVGGIPVRNGVNRFLHFLHLDGNYLTGPIPEELGNFFPEILHLFLNDNYLTGTIPSSLLNLKYSLTEDYLDLRNNCLSTSDDALRAFLISKQIGGDWESYQDSCGDFPWELFLPALMKR